MNYTKKAITTCLSLSLGVLSSIAETWDMDRCIDYALEHNIQVKIQEQDIEQGKLQVSSSWHSFLPQVSAGASQSFNFGRGLTAQNTYANRNTSSFSASAQVSIPLFSGLRNIRTYEQSKLNLQQIALQVEATRDNITLNVIAQYLQVLYSKEVMATASNQVQLSTVELERRRAMAETGKIAEIEVLEAESQLSQDQLTLVNATNDYQLALLDLSQLLQLDTPEGFEVADLDGSEPLIPSVSSVYSDALLVNNTLKAADASVDVADAAIKVAQTGYIPTLSLSGGVGSSYFTVSGMENLPFKKQFRENYSTYIGLSLNIPIFDALSTRTSVKRAHVQRHSAMLQVDQVKNELYKSIQQAHVQASGAKEKYSAAQVSCNASKASFEAMSEKYNIGRATSTEYEQAKTNYFASNIQLIQAHYEYLLRYRILDFYRTAGR